jgi:hypothetical protein
MVSKKTEECEEKKPKYTAKKPAGIINDWLPGQLG